RPRRCESKLVLLAARAARDARRALLERLPRATDGVPLEHREALAAERRKPDARDRGLAVSAADDGSRRSFARCLCLVHVLGDVVLPKGGADRLRIAAPGAARALDETVHGIFVSAFVAAPEDGESNAPNTLRLPAEHVAFLAEDRE